MIEAVVLLACVILAMLTMWLTVAPYYERRLAGLRAKLAEAMKASEARLGLAELRLQQVTNAEAKVKALEREMERASAQHLEQLAKVERERDDAKLKAVELDQRLKAIQQANARHLEDEVAKAKAETGRISGQYSEFATTIKAEFDDLEKQLQQAQCDLAAAQEQAQRDRTMLAMVTEQRDEMAALTLAVVDVVKGFSASTTAAIEKARQQVAESKEQWFPATQQIEPPVSNRTEGRYGE